MQFKDPWVFFILLPLLYLFYRTYVRVQGGKFFAQIQVPSRKFWTAQQGILSWNPRYAPFLAYALASVFFVIALARPQHALSIVKRNIQGIDIMLVLDLSASMRIEDFRDQNRLETAKPIIKEFIMGRPNDKVGFEVFSGEAVTLVPPTLDHVILFDALREVGIGDLKDGTAIGDALSTAVGRLKESQAKSRVIILLTDGDSNVGQVDPLTAGELARGYGIKVYSIAIGRDGRVAMPFVHKDLFGRKVKTYQYFDSSINPDLLRKIAETTGGKFYRVEDDPEVFRSVFKEIDQLETYKIETSERVHYDEKFMKFAWIAFSLCLFGIAIQYGLMRVYP